MPKDFNPRTREGCDYSVCFFCSDRTDFNPRTREGCDSARTVHRSSCGISIHAPVKGATLAMVMLLSSCRYFNPRTREGCDPSRCTRNGYL